MICNWDEWSVPCGEWSVPSGEWSLPCGEWSVPEMNDLYLVVNDLYLVVDERYRYLWWRWAGRPAVWSVQQLCSSCTPHHLSCWTNQQSWARDNCLASRQRQRHSVIELQGQEKIRKIWRSWCLNEVVASNYSNNAITKTLLPENMVTLSR